ncbi:hypothetical protein KEJ23_07670, partial [Candidatus Bathyarchaeota archaeon]|nr:hypothetical protein [Candidatus Bathyarchaeota archaeon]
PVEIFLCAELVTISAFYIFFTITLPALHPAKTNPAGIFIGGIARSPYISASELYSPGMPVIYEQFDASSETRSYNMNKEITEG